MQNVLLACVALLSAGIQSYREDGPIQGDCLLPNGTLSPCAPGNQMCPPGPFGKNTPQFHLRDVSCGINDPNSPVYDPVHGVYHLQYQNHVGLHGGSSHGHVVSRDFTHWAHMPISVWNDRPYDSSGVWTGSATIVDGKVVTVYTGFCNIRAKGCLGTFNMAIAVPADPSDPLQTNWTKDVFAMNPVVNNIARDPSAAWQTPAGEWRLVTSDATIFGSMDFKSWYRIGKQSGFHGGDCPSFFPLPRLTPGADPPADGTVMPTHVHKSSHGPGTVSWRNGKDWMQVGTYVAGLPKSLGNWSATPGVPAKEQLIDAGEVYASKDFYDPVKKRRINWGWAKVPPASTQTLPREVTWHPQLQQLVFSPVEEQDTLRKRVVAPTRQRALTANHSLIIASGLTQGEVMVSFKRPSFPVTLSVNVMAGKDKKGKAAGTSFFIRYVHRENGDISQVEVGSQKTVAMLSLLPSDRSIDLRLYVDNTFTEAFWMNGRVVMTIVTPASDANNVELLSTTSGISANATAWEVGSIWVTPEKVKHTRPLDYVEIQV